ncbi:PREDICTED: uncharacterized protein LOC109234633 [Nicotiana attenuata]|uniref:uncharacterized protein LOC109234633 n=1 Tax=Nicotiana attenuata TaxID=49451 RepID=UPI00090554FC|nr:PREDICTED: uncharacterized protein LOC109234633 [Nicotiana attenuata]
MGHPTHECQASAEVVNAMGSFERGNYQSGNNFNSKGQRHLGLSWRSPGGSANAWQQNNSIPQDESLDTHGATIRELGMALKNLERQVGQLDNLLSERVPGTLPVDIERNPKETINAVSLRSGYVLQDPRAKQKDELIERHVEIVEEQKNNNIQEGAGMLDDALPFQQKQRRDKLNKQFRRFLEVLKQVHVNIPFTEVLSQMPVYVKFLKEILSKEREVEKTSVVKLTKKLEGEIGETISIPMSLQLADQTTIILEVIVEDVLVRVDKFVFPVDFIVVNMEENREVPIILGKPFLDTGIAILDIQEKEAHAQSGGGKGDLQDGTIKGGPNGETWRE